MAQHGHAAPALDRTAVTLREAPRLAFVTGIVGLALLGLLFVLGGKPEQLFRSYLLGWLYAVTLALGGLFFVLLHHACRSGWSVVVRRLAENVSATLPLLALFGVPLAFGFRSIYPWAAPGATTADPMLAHKAAWFSPGWFMLRAAIYLILWSLMAWWFRRQSTRQDEIGALALTRRMQTLSAPAIVVFGLTLTGFAFDWVMSLDPRWYSTVFGVYLFAGIAISAFALLIVLVLLLQRGGRLEGVVTMEHFHDLGKLLFAFVVFWAYIGFSQFMLIWYGNMPEETEWLAARWHGGWRTVSIVLAAAHFGAPFFFLLLRDVKRRRAGLWAAALWMLAVHALDLYWLLMPGLYKDGPRLALANVLALAGFVCLFTGVLAWTLRGRALVPLQDPRLAESLGFENV